MTDRAISTLQETQLREHQDQKVVTASNLGVNYYPHCRNSVPQTCASVSREEQHDVRRATNKPFLVKFASPILRSSRLRSSRETTYTFVERETTDDR